jgi:hypothetical protein
MFLKVRRLCFIALGAFLVTLTIFTQSTWKSLHPVRPVSDTVRSGDLGNTVSASHTGVSNTSNTVGKSTKPGGYRIVALVFCKCHCYVQCLKTAE